MNYHQELLKIIPEIYAHSKINDLFEVIMIHSPKAVIDANKRLNGETVEIDYRVLNLVEIVRQETGKTIDRASSRSMIAFVDNEKKIQAIKTLRALVGIGLKEGKDIIDRIPRNA